MRRFYNPQGSNQFVLEGIESRFRGYQLKWTLGQTQQPIRRRAKRSGQGRQGRARNVVLAQFPAANLRLVDSGQFSELFLTQA